MTQQKRNNWMKGCLRVIEAQQNNKHKDTDKNI